MSNETLLSLMSIDETANAISLLSQVDRKTYEEINNIFTRLGGQWNKKANAHMFQINPRPLINAYLKTGNLPEKNPTAFFPTPSELSNEVLRLSEFSENYFEENCRKMKVLEPSGGVAGIADAIMNVSNGYVDLDIVEILDINQSLLREKGYDPICMDFMEYNTDYEVKYDYVIMNPPFSLAGDSKAYITHVNHAFNMLNETGVLSAIIPLGFMRNSTKKEKEFLELVTQCGSIYKNPSNSFKESGTTIDTYTIVLNKSSLKWRDQKYQGEQNYHTWYGLLVFMNAQAYNNKYFNKVESLEFIENSYEITKDAIVEMIVEENRVENLISVDNIDNMAKCLLRHATEHREYLEVDEVTIVEKVIDEEPVTPVNNTPYDESQLEVFSMGCLF